jgi:hypothetical protein
VPVAVLVPYARGAASPSDIWRGVGGRWQIVFLYRDDDWNPPEILEVMSRFGEVINLDEVGYDGVLNRARELSVRGVVTFTEGMVRLANALASDLGCIANPTQTPLNLTDKHRQRQILNDAQVSVTRFATVGPGSVAAAIGAVGLPAVLKPCTGTASRGVLLVEDQAAVAAAVSGGRGEEWLLEEVLAGTTRPGEPWLGDYVSVEMLSVRGRHRLVGVTDKLPLGSSFRETGMVLPSGLSWTVRQEVAELAVRALDALGMENGITQTEVKLTAHGSRLIEVNGRLGGYIQPLFMRGSDVNPVRLALEVAMGEQPSPGEADFQTHLASLFVLPPAGAARVRDLPAVAALRRLAGVWRVEEYARPGDQVDAGAGSLSMAQMIDVEAASRHELADRILAVTAHIAARAAFD